jgi:hypothetical protein
MAALQIHSKCTIEFATPGPYQQVSSRAHHISPWLLWFYRLQEQLDALQCDSSKQQQDLSAQLLAAQTQLAEVQQAAAAAAEKAAVDAEQAAAELLRHKQQVAALQDEVRAGAANSTALQQQLAAAVAAAAATAEASSSKQRDVEGQLSDALLQLGQCREEVQKLQEHLRQQHAALSTQTSAAAKQASDKVCRHGCHRAGICCSSELEACLCWGLL